MYNIAYLCSILKTVATVRGLDSLDSTPKGSFLNFFFIFERNYIGITLQYCVLFSFNQHDNFSSSRGKVVHLAKGRPTLFRITRFRDN